MSKNKADLNAVLRNDPLAFLEKCFHTLNPGREFYQNWHHAATIHQLERCRKGKTTRLMINMPPRHLKSIMVSVAFPAWLLGHKPGTRIICISYSDKLAKKFSRDCRKIMESKWYRELFPGTRMDSKKNTETEIHTEKNGYRLATSVGGAITGMGGDYLIADDPMKADEAKSEAERNRVRNWFTDAFYTRLDNPNEGVIICVMQRLHVDDPCGFLNSHGDWKTLKLPAIATEEYEEIYVSDDHSIERFRGDIIHPEWMSGEALKQRKREIGSLNFEAQYQQNPVPSEGTMFRRPWLMRYNPPLKPGAFELIVDSWDTAVETGEANDYSVCTTWGSLNGKHYLLDVLRAHLEFPTLLRTVQSHARKWNVGAVLIEKAGGGSQLLQSLYNRSGIAAIPITPKLDKVVRAAYPAVVFESKRVYLPNEAPWLAEFERELLSFPYGKFDDQVDSITQYLNWAAQNRRPRLEMRVHICGESRTGSFRDHYSERMGRGTFDDLF